MKFVWIVRSWCNLDSFWEHVREHKEYDVAYTNPDMILEEIKRILIKEQQDWKDVCSTATDIKETDRNFDIDVPTLEQIIGRPFIKFLGITSTDEKKGEFWQTYYIERLKVVD